MVRDVFWDMNTLESRVEDREVTEIIEVVDADGTTIRTIEGNSGDLVARRSYSINSPNVMGFGTYNG